MSKAKKSIGVLDAVAIDRLLRKAAYCRSFVDGSELVEVRNFITQDLVLNSEPPVVIRNRAARQYSIAKSDLASLIQSCDVFGLMKFLAVQFWDMETCRTKIANMQRKVGKRRSNNAWWLVTGQSATVVVGGLAGFGLAVLTCGGGVAVLAAEGTAFGLQIGVGSKVAFGATGLGLRQLVNLSHSWSESQGWDGIAIATPGKGVGPSGQKVSTWSIESMIDRGLDWVAGNGPLAVMAGAAEYGVNGSQNVFPVVGISLAFKREIEAFNRASESPQERQERLSVK